MISINIPVPKYLKRYLEANYGKNYKATFQDDIGPIILNCLRQKRTIYYEFKKEDYKDFFTISFSMSHFDKYGCTISQRDLRLISKTLDEWFRLNMYRSAIINKNNFNIPYSKSITAYLSEYEIREDELSYSTIRRDFNRKRESIEMRSKKETTY